MSPSVEELLGPARMTELSLKQSRNTAHFEKLRALADEFEREIGAVDLYVSDIDVSDLADSIDFGNFYQDIVAAEVANKEIFERAAEYEGVGA